MTLHAFAFALALVVVEPVPGGAAPEAPVVASPAPEEAAESPERAHRELLDAAAKRERLDEEQLQRAEAALTAAAASAPEDARWTLGLALVARARGERVRARELGEKAAAAAPGDAVAQSLCGTMIFESMGEVGMLEKGSLATRGKAAYERALSIDANNIEAHFGLAMYYLQAPGIAGGSYKKAKEHANAMLAIPGEGAWSGHVMLAQIAAHQEKWDDVIKEYEAAAGAATTPGSAARALSSMAATLIRKKSKPDAALPVIERLRGVATPDDPAPAMLLGEVKHAKKDYAGAAEEFRTALALRPDSANIRYSMAQSLAEAGQYGEAVQRYEEFLEKAPEDKRAGDAKSAVKKLRKKMKSGGSAAAASN